ncbi:autotransporter outer membrane beta-barrel domain-containing protein [Lelliottia sp. V89_10]|uniref:autotransporter outer membrane beta-barrel domain-containing protein n=1 Tax=Lelliottia wanjuensis TaxID=3050585 RepID=UPI00249ED5C6|nr:MULTISPECIES: autotransporter outer membrane beta-barrel domain-containing protein [unclassified Lelliottia]MDI3361341.1 autotransporter outer membrane beta-barrel domain-containing protein [Lelliottia sp. V89_13]MDK9549926.1 autotransporter outer membrane beta-barrel domain-containing protein [Lelliottia sp. V89_5]MDK9595925.1 autotransporter outer membrane beta-barrel domain-containing protein [Lelliottia sp. V89_10]
MLSFNAADAYKQLASTANSHWQLGGKIELGGSTADTLLVEGDLTVTGHIIQYDPNGGTTIAEGGSLTLGTYGVIDGNVLDNGSLVFNSSTDVVYDNNVSGTGSLTKAGRGNLALGGNSTFSGGTTVQSGDVSLQNGQGAGTGQITLDSGTVLDLAFNDASFVNTLNGPGKVKVSGQNIALAEDATNYNSGWDITGSASITQQSQLGTSGVQLDGTQSKLTLNNLGNTFTNVLTGNGTLAVNQSNTTDEFHFSDSMGTAFTGTLEMQKGNLTLDDTAEKALANATLALTKTGIATMKDDRTLDGFTTGGGTLIVDNTRTDPDVLTVKNLDASAGGAIQANIPTDLTPPVISTNPSWFVQDDVRGVQVVKATGEVTGVGTHLTLLDQNGNSLHNPVNVDFSENGQQIGTATYGDAAVVMDDGIWAGYDLTRFDVNAGQTLVLQNEPGTDNALGAQLTGAGNVDVQASGNVILSNTDNDYTGNTTISSGNVQMGSDNAFGHTADLSLAKSTGLDMNGKAQAVTSLHNAAGSSLNLNGGRLTIAQGGESLGTLSGGGQLDVDGGELTVHGANQGLSAETNIAKPATATLDNLQGLGTGAIDLAGNLNLVGVNGVMNNTLTGNGTLSLKNSSQVTLNNTASTFAGSIDVASGTQLTAQGAGTLGTANVVDNGNLVLNSVKDATFNNAISGNGTLSLINSSQVTLNNTASTFSGSIDVASGTQLTAQGAGTLGTAKVVDNGNLVLNSATDETLNNAISGKGGMEKTGAGVLTVGKNQTYSGDTHISQGALNVNGDFASTGTVYVAKAATLKGNGSVAGSVDNSGVIDLTSATPGNNLVVNGDYSSHDGQLWVNSALGGDNSAHDQLTVKGSTSGNTSVTVNNMHGLGAQTTNGIKLVDVQGQSGGNFVLQGRAVAGAYDYALNKASDGDWYLQSNSNSPSNSTSTLRPEGGAWLANQSMANSVFMNTMHDRSDENRQSGEDAPATWAHFDAGRTNSKGADGALSMGSNTSILRIGSDVFRHDFGNQRINAGVMTGYAHVDTDSDAKNSGNHATGKLDGYSVGLYGTWYGGAADQKSGPYVDTWVQYGTFHNTVKGDDLAEEKYHSHNWMASVEAGYDLPLGALTIQPQFQTLYTDYSQGDHTESNGTRIQSKDSGGVTTRLGARLYGELGTETVTQPYVELNWWHGGNDNSVKMDSDTVDQSVPANRYEAKVGAQTKVSANWTLWVNTGVEAGKDNGMNRKHG